MFRYKTKPLLPREYKPVPAVLSHCESVPNAATKMQPKLQANYLVNQPIPVSTSTKPKKLETMMSNNDHKQYTPIVRNVHFGYSSLLLGRLALLGFVLLLQRLPFTIRQPPFCCGGSPGPFSLCLFSYLTTFPCWALLFAPPGQLPYFGSSLLLTIFADWILLPSFATHVDASLTLIFNATFYLVIWACLSTNHLTYEHLTYVPKRLRGWNLWCSHVTVATNRLQAFVWPIPQINQQHYQYVRSATVPQVIERLQRLA
jgi:hypothetical protein